MWMGRRDYHQVDIGLNANGGSGNRYYNATDNRDEQTKHTASH